MKNQKNICLFKISLLFLIIFLSACSIGRVSRVDNQDNVYIFGRFSVVDEVRKMENKNTSVLNPKINNLVPWLLRDFKYNKYGGLVLTKVDNEEIIIRKIDSSGVWILLYPGIKIKTTKPNALYYFGNTVLYFKDSKLNRVSVIDEMDKDISLIKNNIDKDIEIINITKEFEKQFEDLNKKSKIEEKKQANQFEQY